MASMFHQSFQALRAASLGSLVLLHVHAQGCAHTEKPEPFPEVGRFQPSDPAFVKTDPASQKACRADTDCPSGNLCHPGHLVCFDVYPSTRMLNVSFSTPSPADQCRPVNVYFPFDSSELVGEATHWLDYNIRCFNSRKVRHVIIEAHCDARGDIEYNLALSRRRAEAVKKYLEDNGVKVRIDTLGLGKSEPIKPGYTERDYAWNRRAEFRFE